MALYLMNRLFFQVSRIHSLSVLVVLFYGGLSAQNISGIINSYSSVSNISGNVLTVSNTTGFNVCEKVLIIQMKGADITQTFTIDYGDITDYNSAGNYEYAIISAINGNQITLLGPLQKSYRTSRLVQLVSVPMYTNLVVVDTLTCQPWNGSTGGVLVFEADTLIMNSNIDVSKKGFLGGAFVRRWFDCADDAWFASIGLGGQKGEAITAYTSGQETKRAKLANGGGGGNMGNCGAGGGGNYSAGGVGGEQWSGCNNPVIQGIGGALLSYTVDRAFLGGGGGGGYADNNSDVSPGGNGGGIIFINAQSIVGNGRSIISDGEAPTIVSDFESAGGGGAGGTIFLRVSDFLTDLTIQVNGGNGGNVVSTACHGPGGGGGGGILWTSLGILPANVTFIANGGQAGLIQNAGSPCFNTSFGATAGGAGGIQYDLPPLPDLSFSNTSTDTSCVTSLTPLGQNFNTFLWQDGDTSYTYYPASAGTFWVTAFNNCFAKTDTFKIHSLVTKVSDVTICYGTTTILSASGGTSYIWSPDYALNSTTGSSVIAGPTATTIYTLFVTDTINGCVTDTTVKVTIPIVKADFTLNPISGNIPLVVQFSNQSSGAANYLWDFGEEIQSAEVNPQYTFNTGGDYTITLVAYTIDGCTDTLQYQSVSVNDKAFVWVPNSFTPEKDGINDLFKVKTNGILELNCSILDRWGNLIYTTNSLDIDWDGSLNGTDLPQDVYVYLIKAVDFDGKLIQKIGHITLLR